jgi:hypothetical protein
MVNWPATGAMMSGIGAIAAAVGTLFIIVLTWRYVRIYEALLQLNRETLDAMKESVLASRDMAEVMRHQLTIAAADVHAKIEQEHEPFRNLLRRMIEGTQRVRDCDVISAFGNTNLGLRPETSWFIPQDYLQKVDIAKDLDGELHRKLRNINEPPDGALYRMQLAIGRASHAIRPEYTDLSREGYIAVGEVKQLAGQAIHDLQTTLSFVDARAERLRRAGRSERPPN